MSQNHTSKYEQIRSGSNRDWLKASNFSLHQLDQVEAKVYNLGLAEAHSLRVNVTNLHSRSNSHTNLADPVPNNVLKSAWGSNSSIPELLKKHNERVRHSKGRPESATVKSWVRPPTTKRRPHSAKELGSQDQLTNKKPPKGFGVKGAHCDLEERPPGGIASTAGTGWTAPPGGVFDMSGLEIDNILRQVSSTQSRQYAPDMWITDAENIPQGGAGPPAPPRGSPDFTQMLNGGEQGVGFSEMVDELISPSPRPPPSPILVTMPTATFERSETPDIEHEPEGLDSANTNNLNKSPPRGPTKDRPNLTSNTLSIDLNTKCFNHDGKYNGNSGDVMTVDGQGLSDYSDYSDNELGSARHGRTGRRRTVTFNEDMNELTLITPRGEGRRYKRHGGRVSVNELLSDSDSDSQSSSDKTQTLPKPKVYPCRPELKWVKSRIDSGLVQTEQTRQGSAKNKSRMQASLNSEERKEERSPPKISTVSLAYLDDMVEKPSEQDLYVSPRVKSSTKKKKVRPSAKLDNIETMISKITLSDEEADQNEGKLGSDKPASAETKWISPGSLTTKVISGSQKNYYELALQRKLSQQRLKVDSDSIENSKTKTVKTYELTEGAVLEHKVVSTVDTPVHDKKEYIVPEEARPRSSPRQYSQSPVPDKKDHNRPQTPLTNRSQGERKENFPFSSRLQVPGSGHQNGDVHQSRDVNSSRNNNVGTDRKRTGKRSTSSDVPAQDIPRPQSRLAFTKPVEGVVLKTTDEGGAANGDGAVRSGASDINGSTQQESETAGLEDVTNSYLSVPRKPRAASAPVIRKGPTIQNGRLTSGLGNMLSPYASQQKIRPYSASMVNDVAKRVGSAQTQSRTSSRISSRPTSREAQRIRSAARAMNKGTLFQPKFYNTEKFYANYSKPAPPRPITSYLRKKKMATAAEVAGKAEPDEPEVVEIWTRQDDFEIETEGIKECRDLQDRLLEQGVPVTMDTLTRALLPPTECAMRGTPFNISTKPTLPIDNSGLLSRPAVWLPDEYAHLQKTRKAAQRAEQSARERDWEDRHRMYIMSQMSANSLKRSKKKKKKPTRRKSTS